MAQPVDDGDSPFKRGVEENGRSVESNNETAHATDVPDALPNSRNSSGKRLGRRMEALGDWAPEFLAAVCAGSTVKDAVALVGVDGSLPYHRRRTDPEFRAAWNEAADVSTRLLEQEAQRRAYHGTEELV